MCSGIVTMDIAVIQSSFRIKEKDISTGTTQITYYRIAGNIVKKESGKNSASEFRVTNCNVLNDRYDCDERL